MSNDHDHEHDNEQEVTDPVTHLPVKVHDISKVELERIPPNDPEELDAEDLYSHQQQQHSKSSSSSQLSSHEIGDDKWAIKKQDSNARHDALHSLLLSTTGKWYKDPKGDTARARAQAALVSGAAAGLGALGFWFVRDVVAGGGGGGWRWWDLLLVPVACAVIGVGVVGAGVGIGFVQRPAEKPPNPPRQHKEDSEDEQITTPHTLNNLIRSVWPIVNPALFTPLADMLEDSLQSSVPSTIHGVRVSEIGQGKKPIRVVGVRWLDPGAASRDVDSQDKQGDEGQGDGEGQEEGGMKAEEGDFVNLELALAYRSDESTEKDFSERSKNLHLLTHFYLPSNITLPIWMSLTSLLMTVRVRVTLTPNPPFVSLCTLTILGKPHVRLSCTPLAKHFMNVMDIPLLSSYVQSAVDAAVGMYVAPRSICLDLGMLLGGTEQKDVMALGVVLLTVRSANGMKGSGKGDVYVTVCWAKWGKPLWSSRIIQHQSTPVWEETTTLLVGPEEVGSHEMVRVQLWDSDRFTADDHLGTATVSLSDLMSPTKLNKLQIRTDKLTTDSGSPKDGTLTWEVGYFGKVGLREYRSDAEELERKTMEEAERKLSEALPPGEEDTGEEQGEIEQQKKEDLKAKTDDILSSSPPLEEWPSGILCVRIEQIRGLEVIHVRETGVKEEQGEEGEEERGEKELPSSYCSIFVNDVRVYKTRTKMKTRNPYFNASTEKFIRHWPSTTLLISVHDQRTQEVNPLLGVLVLPLKDIFKHSASFTSSMPLVGGVGYGRMQITLLFRSVMMRVPRRLLGWDVGEIRVSRVEVAEGLEGAGKWRVVLSSDYGKAKFVPVDSMVHRSDGEDEYQHAEGVVRWKPNHRKAVHLPILNRYASSVLVKFRKRVVGPDLTPAYGVLWLKDLVDREEVEVDVPIRRNRKKTGVDGKSRCAVQPGERYPEGEGGDEYSVVDGENRQEGGEGEGGNGDGEEEEEEVIGKLRLTVRFVPGLSPAHAKLAKEDKNLREAMDVLRCAEAEREVARGILNDTRSSSPSSSSSSSSSSDTDSDSSSLPKSLSSASSHIPLVHDLKEYHDHADELHRKHRGLMQWSPARKVASLGKGVESAAGDVKRKVKGVVGHSKPEVGIEHEV